MHVALIGNTAWMDEELSALRFLAMGLADENVRVTQVVPEEIAAEEAAPVGPRLTWADTPWPLLRAWRLGRLAPRLASLRVDLLHAMDGRVWRGTLSLARKLGAPAVLSGASSLDVSLAGRLARATRDHRTAFIAATEPLAAAIRQRLGAEAMVRCVPTGVMGDPEPAPAATPSDDHPLCAVVAGSGLFDEDYEALFAAMSRLVQSHPQAQFFLDGQGRDQRLLWQAAQRAGLLANISLVPRRLGHRELLLRADVLIQPQALGKARSLTVQAMAGGKPVLTRADPWLDYLLHDRTCWVIDEPSPDHWEQAVRRVIEQPADAQALGRRARQWVIEHRSVPAQIGQTLALYRHLSGESIKFPGEAVSRKP